MAARKLIIKDKRTLTGPSKVLSLTGKWTPEAYETYREKGCDGVEWLPEGEEKSCEPLLHLASGLSFLTVRSRSPMSDGVLSELPDLRFLDAMTRGKDPLDFNRCSSLIHVGIDDRADVSGLTGAALKYVTLNYTRRPLSFLDEAPNLVALKMEMAGKQTLDFSADLPALEELAIIKGTLLAFSGLHAPRLRVLDIDGVETRGLLDLSPLALMPELRHVTITGKTPTEIAGLDLLRARPEVEVSLGLPVLD